MMIESYARKEVGAPSMQPTFPHHVPRHAQGQKNANFFRPQVLLRPPCYDLRGITTFTFNVPCPRRKMGDVFT